MTLQIGLGSWTIPPAAPAIPDSVVSRPDDNSSTDAGNRSGIVVNPNNDFDRFAARLSDNVSNFTVCHIYDFDDGSWIVENKDISSKSAGDTIIFDISVNEGTEYGLSVSRDDSNLYTEGAYDSPSYPYSGTDFDIVNGIVSGTDKTSNKASNLNDVGNPDNVL